MVFHLSNRPGLFICFPYAPSQNPEPLGCRKVRGENNFSNLLFLGPPRAVQYIHFPAPWSFKFNSYLWTFISRMKILLWLLYTLVSLVPIPEKALKWLIFSDYNNIIRFTVSIFFCPVEAPIGHLEFGAQYTRSFFFVVFVFF